MKNWKISKEFGFDYGHRVWSQTLDKEYSLDENCICRHLHGHRGKVIVSLEANKLKNGMVVDFKYLNWFKQFLDDVLDHKMILDVFDPIFNHEVVFPLLSEQKRYEDNNEFSENLLVHKDEKYYVINPEILDSIENQVIKEKYEGMVFVNFVPTSENLTKWFYEIIDEKMSKIGVRTASVELYETPKSRSIYTNQK